MVLGILLVALLAVSVVACAFYFKFALVHGPYSVPNYRSLHQKIIPRGGGTAVATTSLLGFLVISAMGILDARHALVFCLGGTLVAIAGYADDRFDIQPKYRLLIQAAAAGWVCFWLNGFPPLDLGFAKINFGLAGSLLYIFLCIWLYNLYNFIDGSDGLAGSAAVFICGTMALFLAVQGEIALAAVLGAVACASVGFLFFNWPPARMFMGESGTGFISYTISAVLLLSLRKSSDNLWLWMIVCGYYFADTTTTTTVRALTLPDWYRPHRSHAYQNLVRVWNNHLKVLLLVLGINLFWLMPIAIFAYRNPSYSPVAMLVAYLPIVLFCLKYGPLFQNK